LDQDTSDPPTCGTFIENSFDINDMTRDIKYKFILRHVGQKCGTMNKIEVARESVNIDEFVELDLSSYPSSFLNICPGDERIVDYPIKNVNIYSNKSSDKSTNQKESSAKEVHRCPQVVPIQV